jgi:hypothetical protein
MRSRKPKPGRRPLRKRLWARIQRLLGRGGGFEAPPDWGDEEPALVPVGSPKRPPPSSAVALELPEEPDDVDAYGRSVG